MLESQTETATEGNNAEILPVTEQRSESKNTSRHSTTDTSDSNRKQLSSNSEKHNKEQILSDKLTKNINALLYKSVLKCVGDFETIHHSYFINLDFSSFPLLCQNVYCSLSHVYAINEVMPFCTFMHAMTTCLNAWLFNIVTDINNEDRYTDEKKAISLIPRNMLIPQPIAEYISIIHTVVTPLKDRIYINIPDCCLPQLEIKDNEDKEYLAPGSFGSVTSLTHNAYECYVAPYITRRLVEATRDDNKKYEPLPAGHYPKDTIPNKNLLGYFLPEEISYEGRKKLKKYEFPNTNNMTGRLQLVSSLMHDVTCALSRCSDCFKMKNYHHIERKSTLTTLIHAKMITNPHNEFSRIYMYPMLNKLYSPYWVDRITACQAMLFALRRIRSSDDIGLCYTTPDGIAPDGWLRTINYNHKMMKPFASETGIIHPHVENELYETEIFDKDRVRVIFNWAESFRQETLINRESNFLNIS